MVSTLNPQLLNRTAAWAVCLAGLALCLWNAAGVFWRAQGQSAVAPVQRQTIPTVRPVTSSPSANKLAALHLFGDPGAQPQPIVFQAPETQLELTLVGTLAADDPEEGFAIIADENGNEGYYGKGDEIVDNATLVAVYADRVVLNRSGTRESLSLKREDISSDAPATNRGRATQTRTAAATSNPAPQQNNVNWQAIRQTRTLDPVKLAQQIRAIPFSENGKQIGVRLQAGRDATLLNRLGLRASDIIMAVNGISLDDPSRAFELMRKLNSETQFQVKVRRDGREQTLNINLNQ